MTRSLVRLAPLLAFSSRPGLAAFYYPDRATSLLEHILVDNWGAYASNFSAAITPCTNYVTEVGDPALNSGRTTAAQWMRVLFHDFVTANVTAGTGGVDASIGFETAREENSGSAFNDSFTFWRPFVNDVVPMADLVALGTVMSVSLCGGHRIPYRPGRVDALEADPTEGVPAPETDLATTLLFFNRAGFNTADSIGLTACGHTMGSVHHGGFPQVVPASAVTPTNTNGGINFDTTRGAFDARVVHEYIEWTGNMGGPLVTTENVTTQSDLRLYESDGNATMRGFYEGGDDSFLATCADLLGRAMNTVSTGVTLREVVKPLPVKPVNATLDFIEGSLVLSGKVRVLTTDGASPPATIDLALSEDDTTTLSAEDQTGSSFFCGNPSPPACMTTYFSFSVSSAGLREATSFTVSGSTLETQSFSIQARAFVVPSLTSISGTTVNVTVAAVPLPRPVPRHFGTVQIAAPIAQPGTLAPKIVYADVAVTKSGVVLDGYELWVGAVNLGEPVVGAISVTMQTDDGFADTLMLGAGVAGW